MLVGEVNIIRFIRDAELNAKDVSFKGIHLFYIYFYKSQQGLGLTVSAQVLVDLGCSMHEHVINKHMSTVKETTIRLFTKRTKANFLNQLKNNSI